MERHGICKNVGVCSRANKEQIITDDDADFVCPECGEPLEKIEPKPEKDPTNKKPIIIGAAAVLLAACIGGGVYMGFSGKDTEKPTTESAITDSTNVDSAKVVNDTKEADEKQGKTVDKKEKDTSDKKVNVKKPAGPKRYSFATFDGTTMVFKTSHVIPGTSEVAEPGDKVTGVWDANGEVNSVRWYHADGTASEVLTHE